MAEQISRRGFIGSMTLGGMALALTGTSNLAFADSGASSSSSESWDLETDLLVCGSGGCGMACAIEAKDNGVQNVMVIEKLDTFGGTTVNSSQGMIAGYDTKQQQEQGIVLTYDEMYENLMSNALYRLDPALTAITVESCGKTIDWLVDRIGVPFTEEIMVAYGPLQMMHIVDGGGLGFGEPFTTALADLGIEIQTGTKLTGIILDADGAVAGATVETGGQETRIKAKAVMIATGGYSCNTELSALLNPEVAGTFGIGNIGAEGQGIIAASNVGAVLSHPNDMMCVLKDYEIMKDHAGTSATASVHGMTSLTNTILVGTAGKRFVDEGDLGYMSQKLNSPVFDQIHRDGTGYVWMISDQATVDATEGKTFRGEDLPYYTGNDAAELAAAIGVDPDGLAATIDTFNAGVEAGVDSEFGRFGATALVPPFLAIPVVPCQIITYGGIARNDAGEVLRADGTTIPGLYTGGEASCNSAYMGFTLSNCFTWGRIGGQSAAAYILG